MEKFLITGGRTLSGEIIASGSKNAALPLLFLSLMAEKRCELKRVPDLTDIQIALELLDVFGVSHEASSNNSFCLDPSKIHFEVAPYELASKMRASILILGPLLTRLGHASIPLPGGCAIGARPIDQHLKGLIAMGAKINLENGIIHARAKRLLGVCFDFEMITVTGTINLLMAGVLAKGTTILNNISIEPEVIFLSNLLNKMGAEIKIFPDKRKMIIEGVESLSGFEVDVPPDRVEVGTLMIAGIITKGNIKITRCSPDDLSAVTHCLSLVGAEIVSGNDWIQIKSKDVLTSLDVETSPFPGFPTDLQAQFMSLMCIARGESNITETIFENRFMHVAELNRMGAKIVLSGRNAKILGVSNLNGAPVNATDLRASASLVLAGLAAKGETVIDSVFHLDRGYEALEVGLTSLGAKIERIGS
tara:strand:- start:18126 stop:19385 length:1260 start_codon:yes stop_codon:yes gene_type:complete